MPKTIEFPNPLRVDKLTEVMRVKGVSVYLHWSVLLIVLLILLNALHHPAVALLGLIAYFGVLLIHECGHLIAAQRLHCEVFSIDLYPIFGLTRFQTPWSRLDHCIIAWGGVLAQAVVALPLVILVKTFGYTRFEPVNAVLALLGFFSIGVAAFNLLPIRPLDGAMAWRIVPELFKRASNSRKSQFRSWPPR
jgi:Zn-dependent protease